MRLELANALIRHGGLQRAQKLLESASPALENLKDTEHYESFSERLTLAEARFAISVGKDSKTCLMLDDITRQHSRAARADLLSLEMLLEAGLWHCSNARFAEGRRLLERGRVIVNHSLNVPRHLQVALSLLEAYCVEDSADEFQASHLRFIEALELSRANASVRGTLEATIGLMGYYASVGLEDAMYRFARSALEIAHSSDGVTNKCLAVAWVATTFMKTRHWRCVSTLLFESEQLFEPGALNWIFLKEAQADFLARTGKHEASQSAFLAAENAATTIDNPKWRAIVHRDRALALTELGRYDEGVESMRIAVNLAETAAGAWSRSLTLNAAKRVDQAVRSQTKASSFSAAVDRSRFPPLTLR